MASSRRVTRASIRRSPAPSVDEDDLGVATPKAARPTTRRRTTVVQGTPQPNPSSRTLKSNSTRTTLSSSSRAPTGSLAALLDGRPAGSGRSRRTTSRLSHVSTYPPPRTHRSTSPTSTVELDSDTDSLFFASQELALATSPNEVTSEALSSIHRAAVRLLSVYNASLTKPVPAELTDIYYSALLSSLSLLSPAEPLGLTPYQAPTHEELREANAAIFLRSIWLEEDEELVQGVGVRPERVGGFEGGWKVFFEVFGGEVSDERVLGLFLSLSTQLYILKQLSSLSSTVRERDALLKVLFAPDLVGRAAQSGTVGRVSARERERVWKAMVRERVKQLKLYPLEDLRHLFPYVDFRETLVDVCRVLFDLGEPERVSGGMEGGGGGGVSRRTSSRMSGEFGGVARRSLGGVESIGRRQGRKSEPVPRYSARIPSLITTSRPPRASLPAGLFPFNSSLISSHRTSSGSYLPLSQRGSERRKTPVIQIPPDESSTDGEGEDGDGVKGAEDEDDEGMVEQELLDQLQGLGESDDSEEEEGAMATTPKAEPRAFVPRTGKQKASFSDEELTAEEFAGLTDREGGEVDDRQAEEVLGHQEPATDNFWDNIFDEEPQPGHQVFENDVRPQLPKSTDAQPTPSKGILFDFALGDDDFPTQEMGGAWSPEPEEQQQPAVQMLVEPRYKARKSRVPDEPFDPDETEEEEDELLPESETSFKRPFSKSKFSPSFAPPPRASTQRNRRDHLRETLSPSPPPTDPDQVVAPSSTSGTADKKRKSAVGRPRTSVDSEVSVVPSAQAARQVTPAPHRRFWSDEETMYLVRKAARVTDSQAYARLVKDFGKGGRKNEKLAGRSNVDMKDRLRYYLKTTYPYPDPIPSGLIRYLPHEDPRFEPWRQFKTPKRADERAVKRRRRGDEAGWSAEDSASSSESPSSGEGE